MTQMTDTTPEAEEMLTRIYRAQTPQQKWAILTGACRNLRLLHAAGVRLRMPEATTLDILQDWIGRVLGCPGIHPRTDNMLDPAQIGIADLRVVTRVFETLGLDADAMTAGREVVRHQGQSLVKAMKMALDSGDADAAQLVACECVVLAETKDHSNWELIGHVAKNGTGEGIKVLKQAYDAVEDDEDHHLYHTKGWCRELWIQSLGFPAVLPPPEEVKQVETAIGAARAEQSRDQMRKH